MTAAALEKLLTEHNETLAGTPRQVTYKKSTAKQAAAGAKGAGLKGYLAQIFEKEAEQGYISGSQFENVKEEGGLIEALSAGLLHGGKTTPSTVNPTTGAVTPTGGEPSSAESTEKAAESATSFLKNLLSGPNLIRLLEVVGGGILVLFGLYVIVKKDLPKAVPVPV